MMRLHNGDCLNILKMMIEDEVFVDSIVTDPPYHLNSIVERFGKDNSAPAQGSANANFFGRCDIRGSTACQGVG